VWDDFEPFITGGPDGFDASVFPTITAAHTVGSLGDYLGLPTDISITTSALPFRCYSKIFNEWYRDQDLVDELVISEASGPDTTTNLEMVNAAWEKDYFTSARPWTQKGPEVTLPLSGNAPISGIGIDDTGDFGLGQDVKETGGVDSTYLSARSLSAGGANDWRGEEDPDNLGYPNIYADLSGVSATTINDLRLAFALQRYEEARARYGSRYTEYLRHLGVKSSDARLQRPEYLGGGRQTIQFSEILATSASETGSDTDVHVGDLKGHGIGAMRTNRYRRFFEEHGYVVSMLSVLPKTIYTQGIPRTWSRTIKEDFFQMELQAIGQQEVLNKEIYGEHATPEGVFGYQDRYDEYRRQESTVAGEYRTTELDFWHMARIFATDPTLNSDFVTSNPTKRIHAVQTNDVLWIMANHSIQARRLLAKTGKSFIY